jgi:hypothetical protein
MDLRAGSLLKKVRWVWPAVVLIAAASAQAAPQSGVYSNVCVYPETDDLGGVAIQFSAEQPAAGVFWLCEGGCGWPEPMNSIHVSGDTITFIVLDKAIDGSGKLVRAQPYHYRGRFTPRGLILTSDFPDLGPVILRRQLGKEPTLARAPEKGRNDESTPAPVRRCR